MAILGEKLNVSPWDEFLKCREGIGAKDLGGNGAREGVLLRSLLGHQFSLLLIQMRRRRYNSGF